MDKCTLLYDLPHIGECPRNDHGTNQSSFRSQYKTCKQKNVKSQTKSLLQNGLVTITLSITFGVLLLLVVKTCKRRLHFANLSNFLIKNCAFIKHLHDVSIPDYFGFSRPKFMRKLYSLCLVVRLSANAIKFATVTGISTFVTYVLCHCFSHCFSNANARSMEPIAAYVTTNIKPKSKKRVKEFLPTHQKISLTF